MSNAVASKGHILPVIMLAAAAILIVTTVALGAWLGGDDTWTQATAAAGLAATVVAAAVLLGTARGWADGRRFSLAAVSVVVIGMGAVALVIVTYAGGASDAGISGTDAIVGLDVSAEGAALASQVSNNEIQPPGYAHDVGQHPAFEEFMSMDAATLLSSVPGGTLLPSEIIPLQGQLAAARAYAEENSTVEKAEANGFYKTTNDVPFMGAHYISIDNLSDGVFDAGKPEGLLFSKLGGDEESDWNLVGVWYPIPPGAAPGVSATIPPVGFAGNLDLWHEHHGLCTRAGIISENNTETGCLADSGRWMGDLRWMMHVWVWPENADNSDGVFTYLNQELFEKQGESVQGVPLGGLPDDS